MFCRRIHHRAKGPFIFYEVGGAGGILLSVIKKLHDPPPSNEIFSYDPPL